MSSFLVDFCDPNAAQVKSSSTCNEWLEKHCYPAACFPWLGNVDRCKEGGLILS